MRGVAQATRAGEPRQRHLLNLTGGHFSANTPGLTSHYLPAGCLGLKMVRYDGVLEGLKRWRLLQALDSLRRRLLGRGRSLGGWGCRRLPQNSLKSAYVRVTSSNGRIQRRLASTKRAKMGTGLRPSRCSHRLQTTLSQSPRPTAIRRGGLRRSV